MSEYPKYRAPQPIEIENRVWPTRRIRSMPLCVPVDLRDGNQAFAKPMNVETKIRYFEMLCRIGFREIEVAYPASSGEEFEFVRRLIGEGLIPDGVRINVLTAARKDLIDRTVASLAGVRQATVHCYIATSELHREFVFGKTSGEIMQTAVDGTRMIAEAVDAAGMRDRIRYEFSPEEFSDSEVGAIVELAEAVREAWKPRGKRDFVLNLPATVERRPPYEFADMIESFCRSYTGRNETTLSVHTHNDQGCAVAAAEMAVLAGADRVEGTLAGHGERTGNMDLITFILNLKSRGVEPGLDFSKLPEIAAFIEEVSEIGIHPRAPYTGGLVFTAFSGTHQDAIRKGMAQRKEIGERFRQGWKMPYLHIDPADVGRNYDGLIRINSQSGKGGVAFVMDSFYGFRLPKGMHKEFADIIQKIAEKQGEVAPEQIMDEFRANYLDRKEPMHFKKCQITDKEYEGGAFATVAILTFTDHDTERTVEGVGNGPIDAVQRAIEEALGIEIRVLDYNEHALRSGSGAQAASYIHLMDVKSGRATYGVGISSNITRASIRGIFSAVNRLFY